VWSTSTFRPTIGWSGTTTNMTVSASWPRARCRKRHRASTHAWPAASYSSLVEPDTGTTSWIDVSRTLNHVLLGSRDARAVGDRSDARVHCSRSGRHVRGIPTGVCIGVRPAIRRRDREGAAARMPREDCASTDHSWRVSGWLVKIRARIDDAPTAPLRVSTLAEHAGVHPVYLTNQFRRFFGVSPREHAHWRRSALARDLLEHTLLPLTEIAARLGYADQSHFSRMFTRFAGDAPGASRRRYARILAASGRDHRPTNRAGRAADSRLTPE
jgi:AraC-like DNA-binding protein